MTTHAKLSPSKRHRWAVCPGSIREEAKYPEQESGPSAVDGTHSHTLLEHCIKNGLKNPVKMVGITLEDHDGKFIVDHYRADRVAIAVNYIAKRIEEMNGLCEVLSETRVDPEGLLNRDDLSGTIDCQIRGMDVLEIIDYKDGMGLVGAKGNLQLEQYAIGALAEDDNPYDEVWMTIIQPKNELRGMPAISTWKVPREFVLQRAKVLAMEAEATDDPNAPLVPGDSQCKFCPAKGGCSALASNVMKEIGVMFQPTATPSPMELAEQSANKDPSTMDADQLRQIMEAAPLLRQLLESVEKEALDRMKAGQTIPGLKLVNGRGSRTWAFSEDEMAEKLIKMGIPKTAIYETKLVSPAKAEKLRWEKRDGTKVSLSPRQLKRLDEEYISKLAGKLTVVPESDSRPAVVLDAAPMFKAVEEPAAPAAPEIPSWLM
jgi:hypothetical protein